MATAIAISFVFVVIPIRAAATTDPVLPAADSVVSVWAHCHHCRVRGPVCGVVLDNDTIAADALAAPPLPLSSAMDLMATATKKTCIGTAFAAAVVAAAVMEEEEYDGWEGVFKLKRSYLHRIAKITLNSKIIIDS